MESTPIAEPPIAEPPTRGHKKRARTRRQLVTAALQVIARQGETFTVADVASEAGLAHGTFYNYFDDRDALIAAVVPEVLTGFTIRSATAVGDDDPAARFAVITALALRRAVVAPDQVRVLLRLDVVLGAIVDSPAVDQLRADITAGAATGRFVVDADAATLDVVVGAIIFAARRVVDGEVADDYSVGVVAQLLRSLGVAHTESESLARRAFAVAADMDDSFLEPRSPGV